MIAEWGAGQVVTVCGAMSGTSLDGVDAAVIETDGETLLGFGPSAYRPYSSTERAILSAALGQWDGADVADAKDVVMRAHLEVLEGFPEAELFGFHGQTLSHAPRAQGTLQVGDGARLATQLQRPVVWDFRTQDVALGGEGAPLAPFFHFACAKWFKATHPVIFLNLGGVGNLTWVDPTKDRPDADGALLAFDTGPANAPINDLVQTRLGQSYDKDGALAATGHVQQKLVDRFLDNPYLTRKPPKSLDRNDFADAVQSVSNLSDADAAATLTAMSAAGVRASMAHCPEPPSRILVTGGGRHNQALMQMIATGASCPVAPVETVGLNGDMLEAQAFAYLAVRVARGLPTSCPSTTGVQSATSGGKLSFP